MWAVLCLVEDAEFVSANVPELDQCSGENFPLLIVVFPHVFLHFEPIRKVVLASNGVGLQAVQKLGLCQQQVIQLYLLSVNSF